MYSTTEQPPNSLSAWLWPTGIRQDTTWLCCAYEGVRELGMPCNVLLLLLLLLIMVMMTNQNIMKPSSSLHLEMKASWSPR
jgi:hypothetical protein